jgi:hypothetical protein
MAMNGIELLEFRRTNPRPVDDFLTKSARNFSTTYLKRIELLKARAIPLIEVVDIRKTAQTLEIQKPFIFIERLIIYIKFASNTILFTTFGKEAALTNGIQLSYNDMDLLDEEWKDNSDFLLYAYDVRTDTDATGTKINILTSRFTFTKFTPNGIYMEGSNKLEIKIGDDLSSSNTEVKLVFEGWKV